jgi:hypothetical protein
VTSACGRGGSLQQFSQHGCGVEHLLEVVQHNQHVTVGQVSYEGVPRPAFPGEAER